MNKENNRSAAGLRRSAVAERIRLREEWTALKGIAAPTKPAQARVINKKSQNLVKPKVQKRNKLCSDVLLGVVALVEVGTESRALALRAALAALGATVMPSWSPLVTHLVWAQDGSRSTRAKARVMASRLVSPLWVEACAAAGRRLPELAFPAAARQSDLPSPRTLRHLLKRAEMENKPLVELLADSKESNEGNEKNRLRISSETEEDISRDTSNDTIDVMSRVNTAQRRALPASQPSTPTATPPRKHSRRKLFTQREANITAGTHSENEAHPRTASNLTGRQYKELVRAARLARRMVAACVPSHLLVTSETKTAEQAPWIVLTGMPRHERQIVHKAIQSLRGRVQKHVNKKTTHVLLGSCRDGSDTADITGVSYFTTKVMPSGDTKKARTLNALLGAARGCRVLYGQWALDSLAAKRWLHPNQYEVPHLKKISQKARVERKALRYMRSDYGYDVFSGMRVRVSNDTDQRDAAIQLLNLCGAVVLDHGGEFIPRSSLSQNGAQNVGLSQNSRQPPLPDHDIRLGSSDGEVHSKWVFDSVAASRMRTTRRYLNGNNCSRNITTQDTGI